MNFIKPQVFVKKVFRKMRGFTMAEFLISLAIIGALAMILLPVLKNIRPDELEALHKKGQYTMEHIVSDLAYDEDIYPPTKITSGLASIFAVNVAGKTYGYGKVDTYTTDKNNIKAKTKFCELFASRVNLASGSTVNCSEDAKTFTTVEGIDWYLPISNFDGARPYEIIRFDVNGDKEPNCTYDKNTCPKPDTFKYYLTSDGKIYQDSPDSETKYFDIVVSVEGNATVTCDGGSCLGKTVGDHSIKVTPAVGWQCEWKEKSVYLSNANYLDKVVCKEYAGSSKKKGKIKVTKIMNKYLNSADGDIYLRDQLVNFTNCSGNAWQRTCTAEVEADVGVLYNVLATPKKNCKLDKISKTSVKLSDEGEVQDVSVTFSWDVFPSSKHNVTFTLYKDAGCEGSSLIGSCSNKVNVAEGTSYGSCYIKAVGDGCVGSWTVAQNGANYDNSGIMPLVYGTVKQTDVNLIGNVTKVSSTDEENKLPEYTVKVNIVCADGATKCGGVTGNGTYTKGSEVKVSVEPMSGYRTIDGKDFWSKEFNISSNYTDTVTLYANTYCVNLTKSGNGNIYDHNGNMITGKTCGFAPGTYAFKAVGSAGYKSDWTDDTMTVVIRNKDVSINCNFTKEEDKTYCLSVSFLGEDGKVCKNCGTALLSGNAIAQQKSFSADITSQCSLPNGTYTLRAMPYQEYLAEPETSEILIDNDNAEATLQFYRPISISYNIDTSNDGVIYADGRETNNYVKKVKPNSAVAFPKVIPVRGRELKSWRCKRQNTTYSDSYDPGATPSFSSDMTCTANVGYASRSLWLYNDYTNSTLDAWTDMAGYWETASDRYIKVSRNGDSILNLSRSDTSKSWSEYSYSVPLGLDINWSSSYYISGNKGYWRMFYSSKNGSSVSFMDFARTDYVGLNKGSSMNPVMHDNPYDTSGFYFRNRRPSAGTVYIYACFQYELNGTTQIKYTSKDLDENQSLADNVFCTMYTINHN